MNCILFTYNANCRFILTLWNCSLSYISKQNSLIANYTIKLRLCIIANFAVLNFFFLLFTCYILKLYKKNFLFTLWTTIWTLRCPLFYAVIAVLMSTSIEWYLFKFLNFIQTNRTRLLLNNWCHIWNFLAIVFYIFHNFNTLGQLRLSVFWFFITFRIYNSFLLWSRKFDPSIGSNLNLGIYFNISFHSRFCITSYVNLRQLWRNLINLRLLWISNDDLFRAGRG
jgi:hypothetical protein